MELVRNDIDILEEEILRLGGNRLLSLLLKDRTITAYYRKNPQIKTKKTIKNIVWGTDLYEKEIPMFSSDTPISVEDITGLFPLVIQPRSLKAKEAQRKRTRLKAEVFTPSWVCNKQNNLIDARWFGKENVFNEEIGTKWISRPAEEKIPFDNTPSKSWKNYVDEKRLEIACGEAPYLVSWYDTVTGNLLPIHERIGMLDRKLRVVNERTETEEEWKKWVKRAFQSIYGYEYQGDSLLLARENLLYTYIQNYQYKLDKEPSKEDLIEIAKIISWNIWQMDGFDGLTVPNKQLPKRIPCIISDWTQDRVYGKSEEFNNLYGDGGN